VPLARRSAIRLLREQPDVRVGVFHRVQTAFEPGSLAAEQLHIPRKCSLGIRHAKVKMVEPEQLGVFDELELHAERILDEGELEEPRGVARSFTFASRLANDRPT
jgi:hypothetical protein